MIELSIVQRENQININKTKSYQERSTTHAREPRRIRSCPKAEAIGSMLYHARGTRRAKYCTKPAGKFGAHLSLDSSLVSFAPITYLDEFSRGLEVSSSPKSNLSMTVFLVRSKLMRDKYGPPSLYARTMKNTILAPQQISIALLSLDNFAEICLLSVVHLCSTGIFGCTSCPSSKISTLLTLLYLDSIAVEYLQLR